MQTQLGVDTGGTFTDFVWIDANGRFQIHKQLSTPHDPSVAILTGIDVLDTPEAAGVVHGSTVATNALLERKGARTALITTAGFADVLAIGRQNRPEIYALVPQRPAPLVPAAWRFEVSERVTAQAEILEPLSQEDVTAVVDRLKEEEIESVAVCLLFSFLRPEHERQILQALRATFSSEHLHVSLSSDILPEYREYERTATTVINAYVAPKMSRYLSRLADGLAPRRLTVMQSSGGVISAATAGAEAARTVLSGPAGGVVGARFVASQAGFDEIITFDMGGTSTDVSLCPGRLPTSATGEISGRPLRLPIIDIHTVGAGGGSLAYVDAGGALHVGPESAGADPGPACYGNIEEWETRPLRQLGPQQSALTHATTTDANLILGRLDAHHFLGGTMQLNETAAHRALRKLARFMGVDDVETAAWGVIQVANANMERAIRRISVERGYDPRRFVLVPFGGAGPLHACELAQNLQIPRVLAPPVPGVLSALGMLVAAPTKDYSQTVMKTVAADDGGLADWLQTGFEPLAERALAEMVAEGHDPDQIQLQQRLDMRYQGQSHELTIPFTAREPLLARFHQQHQKRYGYQQPAEPVEIVTLRLTAVAPVTPPELPAQPLGKADASEAILGDKQVWFAQQPQTTTLYAREKLRPGHQFAGPAVVFQYDTTIVIPPDWQTAVDAYGNLIVTHVE